MGPNRQNAGRIVFWLGLSLVLITMSGASAQNQPDKSRCAAIPVRRFKPKLPTDLTGVKSAPTIKYMIEMDGSVSHVTLERSSGSKSLDDAALDAARKSSYRPLKKGCGPQESVLTFTLDPLTDGLS